MASDTLDRPLMGVRRFIVGPEGLHSISGWGPWDQDMPKSARCRTYLPDHEDCPGFDCVCGYNAFYTLQADTQGGGYYRWSSHWSRVRAVVSAWGDVVLADRGFRSQYMQIEALIRWGADIPGPDLNLNEMAGRYSVPVINATDVEDFCSERGEVLLTYEGT